jgi:serine/threonine protein kinase
MPRRQPLTADFDATVLAAALPRHVHAGYMRYREFEPIARGGKAEVFRCVDGNLGREVALKVLHRHLADSPLEQQLLVREARIMAALRHPAIPEIHDLGRDSEGRPYFAMSLKVGPTLHQILTSLRNGDPVAVRAYDLERLLGVLVQTAETLRYAHAMNVVHCDLKPENILIDATDRAHVLDWGLAVINADERREDGCPTVRERGCQGSPLYMAPEQVPGDQYLTPAVDVYGLGVLLYECLTLDTPCRGETTIETLKRVLEVEPAPPREIAKWPAIPPELEAACLRALSKSPADRFASIAEFCDVLVDCRAELLTAFERGDSGVRSGLGDLGAWDDDDAQRPTQRSPRPDAELPSLV